MKVIIILPNNLKEVQVSFEFEGQNPLTAEQKIDVVFQGHNQAQDFEKHPPIKNDLNLKLAQAVDKSLLKTLKDTLKSDFGVNK